MHLLSTSHHDSRVFLVTVHEPICTEEGDLEAALYGSFLPVPSNDIFPAVSAALYARENAPGAIVVKKDRIRINQGRERVKLRVTNNGDRPIQVRVDVYIDLSSHSRVAKVLRDRRHPHCEACSSERVSLTDWISLSLH